MNAIRVGRGRLDAFDAMGSARVRAEPSTSFPEYSMSGRAISFLLSFGPAKIKRTISIGPNLYGLEVAPIRRRGRLIWRRPRVDAVHRQSPVMCVPESGGIAE